MTREIYLEKLKSNQFDLEVFYDYYNEINNNENLKLNFAEFQESFTRFINFVNPQMIIEVVKDYFNRKFNITTATKDNIVVGYF